MGLFDIFSIGGKVKKVVIVAAKSVGDKSTDRLKGLGKDEAYKALYTLSSEIVETAIDETIEPAPQGWLRNKIVHKASKKVADQIWINVGKQFDK